MSTIFNPNIPSNDDSVYDAYFSFHTNMQAINNLVGVDHFPGTATQHRGYHKQITIPEALDAPPKPTGNIGIIYTGPSTTTTTSNAPVLKFANKDGDWEIPLGAQSQPGPGPTPQPQPEFEGPEFSDTNQGGQKWIGYCKFKNKFAVMWWRTVVGRAWGNIPAEFGESGTVYPLPFQTIFYANVEYGNAPSGYFQFERSDTQNMIPPNFQITTTNARILNRNKTQNLSASLLVIGILK